MLSEIQFSISAEIVSLIKTVIWPLIVIVAFFSIRKPLIRLIERLTKLNIAGHSMEAIQPQIAQNLVKEPDISNVEKALGYFRLETISQFEGYVKTESNYDKVATDAEKIDILKKYATVIYIKSHFEIIFSDIFGSQIRLLQHLNGFPKESYDSLKRFYVDDLRDRDYGYDLYMNFLFRFELIVKEENRIGITILGVDFLKFIVATNKNIDKPF